jgi:hypothetical protein
VRAVASDMMNKKYINYENAYVGTARGVYDIMIYTEKFNLPELARAR